jgi:predicted nuclease of predicted toxin-antitoxin system
MARLLVDMNLSIEWIPLLTTTGHGAVHSRADSKFVTGVLAGAVSMG